MKYLIMLAIAAVFSSCTNDGVVITQKDPGDNPVIDGDPTLPTEPPTQPLNGTYIGEMSGTLLDTSTFKILIKLVEPTDGKFIDNGEGTGGNNYYKLWDQNQPIRPKNIPHYDGFATGERTGSVLNLSLRLNYRPCFVNMKAYISTDSKTLSFFATNQTVKCSIATLKISLKAFTMKLQ